MSAANAPRIRHKQVASRIARSRGSTRSTDSGFWAMSPPQICHPSQTGTPHPRSDNGNREEDRRSGNGASVVTRSKRCQCTFTSRFARDKRAQICIRTVSLVMSPRDSKPAKPGHAKAAVGAAYTTGAGPGSASSLAQIPAPCRVDQRKFPSNARVRYNHSNDELRAPPLASSVRAVTQAPHGVLFFTRSLFPLSCCNAPGGSFDRVTGSPGSVSADPTHGRDRRLIAGPKRKRGPIWFATTSSD